MNTSEHFFQQVFENSLQPNIIFIKDGSVINANKAACKLLGYSKKDLLIQNRSSILSITKKTLQVAFVQENMGKHTTFLGTALSKSGNSIQCEITYSVFNYMNDKKYWITTITDRSKSILLQKLIDCKKEKKVSRDIFISKTKQKHSVLKNKKSFYDTILQFKSKQKNINALKKKKVAENIIIAKTKQKHINISNKKIVSKNILLVKSKQRSIDIINKRKVFDNILLAKSIQKNIDVINEKKVAENILTALLMQREIDTIREKIVNENIGIALAKSNTIHTEHIELIKNLGQSRNAERLEIGKQLNENVSQLLCASRIYINMAKTGGKETGFLLNTSCDYTVMALEEITKLTKMLA